MEPPASRAAQEPRMGQPTAADLLEVPEVHVVVSSAVVAAALGQDELRYLLNRRDPIGVYDQEHDSPPDEYDCLIGPLLAG
jgi:hypothetical protein